MITRHSWAEIATRLVDTAMGRQPADLVIRRGRWVNVNSGEIIDDIDVAIAGSRIAYCGPDADFCIGPATRVIEAQRRYLVPGLIDGHTHIEVTMLTATEFARAVIPHGTTGMVVDPHEIANVFGLDGVRMMLDEIATLPINIYVQIPSGVPSVPGLETSGASFGVGEIAEALRWPGVVGLAEVMNFAGVAANEPLVHGMMAEAMRAGKTVSGHYASPDLGRPFHAYVAGGPADDHEGTRESDAIERVRRGMRAVLRRGTTWYDVAAQITAVTEKGLDPRHFMLCTDGILPETLVHEGHMDWVLRHVMDLGVNPMLAIQMATLNAAEHFHVDRDVGSIAPGRFADILVVSDLQAFTPDVVVGAGVILAEQGRLVVELPSYRGYPRRVYQSVQLKRPLREEDFLVSAPPEAGDTVRAHVIGVTQNAAVTRHLRVHLEAVDGQVQPDPVLDVAQVALVERHQGTGEVVNAFVQGFGLQPRCAVASTVSHDCHHLVVVGTAREEMALAANELARAGGGIAVFSHGKKLALVDLPIAGLMSTALATEVMDQLDYLDTALRQCGCHIPYAYKLLSMLALVSIPELRLSNLGLVDVERFALISPVDLEVLDGSP